MVQKTGVNCAHQVDLLGGTYDSSSPELGSALIYVSAERYLAIFETNIFATAAVNIYLPNVSEASGMTYIITGSAAAVICDRDESYGWEDCTLDAGEVWTFTSNGVSWNAIKGSHEKN